MVVFGGLKLYSEQPVGPRTAAQRQHGLIQVLLGLQGQQQLKGQENIQHATFHSLLFHKDGMSTQRHMHDAEGFTRKPLKEHMVAEKKIGLD